MSKTISISLEELYETNPHGHFRFGRFPHEKMWRISSMLIDGTFDLVRIDGKHEVNRKGSHKVYWQSNRLIDIL